MKKLFLFFLLFCVVHYSFAQTTVKTFLNLNELMHADVQKNQPYKLADNINGGGLFIATDKTNNVIDSGIVFPTNNPNIVLLRKMIDTKTVELKWFGVNDSVHNFMPAFNKATKYLTIKNGGTIIFPEGTFLAEPYFSINANNITVKGADINKTFIKVPPTSGGGLVVNSNYRYAGWLTKTEDLITYKENALTTGSDHIDLKIKSDKNRLPSGTIIFINAGANYYDQSYGEFNIVDHCDASGKLFLKYKLSRNYTQAVSSWTSTLTTDFTPPAQGSNGTIYFSGTQPRAGITISIGNDLYKVITSTASSAVVFNPNNKGNSNNIIKLGTHIFLCRAIIITPSVVYNTVVENLTVTGRRKAVIVSNTFKTNFKNVRFNCLPQSTSHGILWLDGDDGRDFNMTDCEINCPVLSGCQFARSFADIYISNTKFNQSGIQFSEFNINANVTNCEFFLANHNMPDELSSIPILLGNTCSSINFIHNKIHVSNVKVVFYNGEIQGYKAAIASTININNNTIYCDNVGTLFSGAYAGNVYILNNTISGTVNFLFQTGVRRSLNPDFKQEPVCIIKDNTFSGNIDGFGGSTSNVQYIHNTIKRTGAAKADYEFKVWGNVIYNHVPADTSIIKFVLKDNSFFNWELRANSLSHYWPLSERTEISNNHFYNNQKDSVITLKAAVK